MINPTTFPTMTKKTAAEVEAAYWAAADAEAAAAALTDAAAVASAASAVAARAAAAEAAAAKAAAKAATAAYWAAADAEAAAAKAAAAAAAAADLSPAAQAVTDAACTLADLLNREVSQYEMIAAALEALADQVVPDHPKPSASSGPLVLMNWTQSLDQYYQRQATRSEILSIAAELKQ